MKKTPKARAKTSQPEFKGFVNIPLDKTDKERIKATTYDLSDVDNWLLKLTEQDMKVSFSFDDYNQAYCVFLVPKPTHRNAGYIVAGRGSTPSKALRQLIYILGVLPDDWSEYGEPPRDVIDD